MISKEEKVEESAEFFMEFLNGRNFNLTSYKAHQEPESIKCPVTSVSLSAADITIASGLRATHRIKVDWKKVRAEKGSSSYIYESATNTYVFWIS